MKRSILAMSLVLATTLLGCQKASDPEAPLEDTKATPDTIKVQRFDPAEIGDRAPIPFRETGDLYVLETGCDCILAITPAGEVSIAVTTQQILDATGGVDVSLTGAGLAFDEAGTMYFGEADSQGVLKLERGGTLAVLASGASLRAVTGQAEFDPEGLALDSTGGLYVNDNVSASVVRIDVTTGVASVMAGGTELGGLVGLEAANLASSLVVGKGGIIFTTNEDDPQAIIGIDPAQGPGVFATSAMFEQLGGYMTVTRNGEVVVVDSDAEIVFLVSTTGDVTTFLSEAQLQGPIDDEDGLYDGGIAFDGDDNFYITEVHQNHILRFDTRFRGTVWVNRATIQTVTRTRPDLDGGIAFAPRIQGGE